LEIIKEKSRDDIDEDKSFLMSLVPSFKKLNDEQKFVAKVEFLNVMRRITFCQSPCHGSNQPQFQSYSNLPGPSAHTSYTGTLPSIKIPSGTHHKVCNEFQHQHNQSITAAVNIQQTSQDAPGINSNCTTTSRPLISISNKHVNQNPRYPHPNTNNPTFPHSGSLPHRPAHHKLGPKSHPKHRKLQIINHSVQP
jgi:hypothetical protein